jgi:soluble lytic murein transglycosylase
MKKVLFIALALVAFAVAALLYLHPTPYRDMVREASERYGVSEALIYAVMKTESGFKKDAVSRAGALGLMQITPDTFDYIIEKMGIEPPERSMMFDPETSIHFGAYLLSRHIKEFKSIENALCAYNAGRGALTRWLLDERYSSDGVTLQKIPYPETRDYVAKVMLRYKIYDFLT